MNPSIIPLKRIYSLGTSNRTKEEFINILKKFNIEVVIDVRRFPTSRFEHFKKANLLNLLKRNKIKYIYMGDKLGGYRDTGYESYTRTDEFLKSVEILEKVASNNITTFICAEKFPWKCHRKFIALCLREKNWEVTHIIDENRIWKK